MSTAIVTGASTGFGRALALDLARAGWDLVVDARTGAELEAAAREFAAEGNRVSVIVGDVTDPDHVRRLVEAAVEMGGIDLLVNNASMLGPSPQPVLAEYPLDTLSHVFEVNLVAPLRLIQQALPALRRSRGIVVNVTSDAAVEAYEGWGGYGASKAALEQLSNVLASEEPGITVYWFDPGDMNTRMHQAAFPGEDISDRPQPEERSPAVVKLIEDRLPSGRYQAEQLLTGSPRR